MVDPGRVRRLLEELEGYSTRLAALTDLALADYEGDRALAGRYLVQVSADHRPPDPDVAHDRGESWRAPWRPALSRLRHHDSTYNAARMR